MVTHCLILNLNPFLAFHHGTVDIRDDLAGTRNIMVNLGNDPASTRDIMMNLGNDPAGVRNVMTNVGNSHMRVYCKFGLDVGWSIVWAEKRWLGALGKHEEFYRGPPSMQRSCVYHSSHKEYER